MKKNFEDIVVEYIKTREITQGGPIIGNLSVNQKLINKDLWGGPCLYRDGYLYLPKYVQGFLQTGFRLVRIDIFSLEVRYLSKALELIWLDKIEDDKIYYYIDINRKRVQYIFM